MHMHRATCGLNAHGAALGAAPAACGCAASRRGTRAVPQAQKNQPRSACIGKACMEAHRATKKAEKRRRMNFECGK